MKTKFKDIVLITAIALIALIGFLMFSNVFKNTTYNMSLVVFNKEVVAEVDFVNKEVNILKQDEGGYPKLNEELQTITILGNSQGGERFELVIKYNYENHSMQIVEEVSPKNICSSDGEQTARTITCIPNGVTITFSNDGEVELDDII